MNREIVDNILEVIRTSMDKNVIVRALVKLRTDLVHTSDGIELFYLAGGVLPMIRLLHKPHEKILEVVLSILGNCCTDAACSKQAFAAKIVPPLATILKSISNPIIQCRACRLLGNLAKTDNSQLATHCQIITQAVCQIIVETSDVQTRIMAFRACRFLLSHPSFLKHFLQSNGFAILLRILASIMKNNTATENEQTSLIDKPESMLGLKRTQHREQYFQEVARHFEGVRSDIFDHEVLKNASRFTSIYAMPKEKAALDLACEILKCLLVMSELQIAFTIWEAITRSGCTLMPVVFCASEENKHRSVSLKILSNFSKNPGAFYILSSSDAIVAACELLVSSSSNMGSQKQLLSESERRHCINIVSMLSPDACNRSKIRRSDALRKLIALLRESESEIEVASILQLLNYFQYDNMSLDLMFREGLILVLIKELNAFLTHDDEYHRKRREERVQNAKKRKLHDHSSETTVCKFAKKREESTFLESPSSSPHSIFAPNSPCSSRSMSPSGGSPFKLDCESDDETYSPVCSDDDDEEDDAINNGEGDNGSGVRLRPQERASGAVNGDPTSPVDNGNSEIMKLLDLAATSEILGEDEVVEEDENIDDDISRDSQTTKSIEKNASGNLLPMSTIDVIENLFFRATLLIHKRAELGKPETLSVLVKAVNMFGTQNNFAASLTNILLESQFFAQVIKQGIAHQLYQLSKIQEMQKDGLAFLETLTCVGESNYGKAELARLLRCDDVTSQIRAAITVAHIIKGHRLLYQFLNDGNALTVLLDIILHRNRDELTAEAVEALTAMCCHTLDMKLPKIDDEVGNTRTRDQYDAYNILEDPYESESCDMCFLVYSGCKDDLTVTSTTAISTTTTTTTTTETPAIRVAFRKQLLCDASEVFNTMLNSDFREGKEGEIHLYDYSVDGLRYFLDLVVRLTQQQKLSIPPQNKYSLLLEAFEMSRVYIIPSIEEFVQQLLICLLDAENCLRVFEWAMKNHHAELLEMSINYYLCSQLANEVKVKLFRNADDSNFGTEWFQMLYDAVFVRCRTGLHGIHT